MNTYAPCNQPVLLRSIEPGQFTSWAFTRRALDSGLVPSTGSKGDCYDCTVSSPTMERGSQAVSTVPYTRYLNSVYR